MKKIYELVALLEVSEAKTITLDRWKKEYSGNYHPYIRIKKWTDTKSTIHSGRMYSTRIVGKNITIIRLQ